MVEYFADQDTISDLENETYSYLAEQLKRRAVLLSRKNDEKVKLLHISGSLNLADLRIGKLNSNCLFSSSAFCTCEGMRWYPDGRGYLFLRGDVIFNVHESYVTFC